MFTPRRFPLTITLTNHSGLATSIACMAISTAGLNACGQNLFLAPMPAPVVAQQSPPSQTQPAAPAPAANPAAPAAGKPSDGQSAQPAQSAPAQPITGASMMSAPPSLKDVSLMVVIVPEPHKFQLHDKIDIIINETTNQKSEQKLDTKKSYNIKGALNQFPSLQDLLLKNTLDNGIGETKPSLDASGSNDYKGNGTYERKDNFTARIAATVIDVKPNGLLVIEARKSVQSNKEEQVIVISGLCDPKDITKSNTVQSAQLADLTIRMTNTGQVKDSAEKGMIPTVLEQLFGL